MDMDGFLPPGRDEWVVSCNHLRQVDVGDDQDVSVVPGPLEGPLGEFIGILAPATLAVVDVIIDDEDVDVAGGVSGSPRERSEQACVQRQRLPALNVMSDELDEAPAELSKLENGRDGYVLPIEPIQRGVGVLLCKHDTLAHQSREHPSDAIGTSYASKSMNLRP